MTSNPNSACWPPPRASMCTPIPAPAMDRVKVIEVGNGTKRYTIEGKDADRALWYEIQYDSTNPDLTAWIRATHVQTQGDPSGVPVVWKPVQQSLDSDANVRSGPAATNAKVGFISGGSTAKYDILGRDARTAAWYQILFGRSGAGWVSAAHVQTHGGLKDLAATWTPGSASRPAPPTISTCAPVPAAATPGAAASAAVPPRSTRSWARTRPGPPGTKFATAPPSPAGFTPTTCRPTAAWSDCPSVEPTRRGGEGGVPAAANPNPRPGTRTPAGPRLHIASPRNIDKPASEPPRF